MIVYDYDEKVSIEEPEDGYDAKIHIFDHEPRSNRGLKNYSVVVAVLVGNS